MSSVPGRWRDDVHQQSYVDMMDMNWGIKISITSSYPSYPSCPSYPLYPSYPSYPSYPHSDWWITNQQNLVLKIGWSTPKANAWSHESCNPGHPGYAQSHLGAHPSIFLRDQQVRANLELSRNTQIEDHLYSWNRHHLGRQNLQCLCLNPVFDHFSGSNVFRGFQCSTVSSVHSSFLLFV